MKLEAIKLAHTGAWAFFVLCILPEWLARENQRIFGGLDLGGVVFAMGRWIYS